MDIEGPRGAIPDNKWPFCQAVSALPGRTCLASNSMDWAIAVWGSEEFLTPAPPAPSRRPLEGPLGLLYGPNASSRTLCQRRTSRKDPLSGIIRY